MDIKAPRGIAVFDVGTTNTKWVLFDKDGHVAGSKSIASERLKSPPYLAIDPEPIFAFTASALPQLDKILPIDVIVTSAHGSALALLDENDNLALPVMDYMANPPADIIAAYKKISPPFEEVLAPVLPGALTLGLQLFWQKTAFPEAFSRVKTILPWGQYVSFRLGGEKTTELSALGAQTHLWDYINARYSSTATHQGWAQKFAPVTPAYAQIGTLAPQFCGQGLRGAGALRAGVHDSDANYLRYLAGVKGDFTLLSTGTWIIGYDTKADFNAASSTHDTVANLDIFGRPIAVCRFFGGREYEIISEGHDSASASLSMAQNLIDRGIFALPSFTDSGGPMPGTGGKGKVYGGDVSSDGEKATLASLYCALMVSESLDAIGSKSDVIVDGPFSTNKVFLALLACLRQPQNIKASTLRDGTTDGARIIGLMGSNGQIPTTDIELLDYAPASVTGLQGYLKQWRELCKTI